MFDESSRGLLFAKGESDNLQNIRRTNFFNQSSGSAIIEDSREKIIFDKNPIEISESKKKEEKTIQNLQTRSRNAKAKLNKQKKHRVFVEDLDHSSSIPHEVSITQPINPLDDGFFYSHPDKPEKTVEVPPLENMYFIKGHVGQYDSDYVYEEESAREKRLMRGLTRRMNELGKQSKVLGISQKKEEIKV